MGRKLLTLIITCSGCFYRNTLPPCTNNISFRICAISKHCFKVQRMTSLQAFSEACASSSSSTWNVFFFVVLKQQKEAARKTAVPGKSVTFGQSATFALIRKMDVGITTAHGSTETARGSALLCNAAAPGHHRAWWLSSTVAPHLQPHCKHPECQTNAMCPCWGI